MKKYIKPELEINLIDSISNVASDISGNFANLPTYGNDVGTLDYEDLF